MKIFRELLAVFGLLGTIFSAAFNYADLPRRIAVHFNAAGVANGWGDKSVIWMLVGVACLLYLSLSLVPMFPGLINVPVAQEQRAAAIPLAIEMIAWLKAEIACIFAYITWSIVSVAEGTSRGLGVWFLPVTMAAIFLTMGLYLARMLRLPKSAAA